MKTDFQSQPWSAEAEARFAATPLGVRLADRLASGPPRQARLAEWLLRHPLASAARGIEEVAAAAGVSAATLSRFARELGFPGFAEFRAALADAVGASFDPVSKLREGFGRAEAPDAAADSLAAARGHLDAMTDPGLTGRLRAAAGRIGAARTVYVMGFGFSAHLAAMLALHLQPYREGVVNLVQFGGTEVAAGRLAAVGPGDLLIALSFPRYAADAPPLARFAREQGGSVMALTDSPAAPLVRWAETALFAPALHPVLSSTQAPALALIEALVSAFILSDPAHVARAERLSAALRLFLLPDRAP